MLKLIHTKRGVFKTAKLIKSAQLKVTLRYIWPQASKQTYIHTTSTNAVTLVWGSLRLAPISV